MKPTIILTIIIFSFCQRISAQNPTDFYGTWYLVYESFHTGDTLIFSKDLTNKYGWGAKIEIYENGDFVDSYTSKCGTDERVHSSKGNWTYDTERNYFETTVSVNLQKKKYKVDNFTSDKLVLIKP